jgi:hypothetical protein
METNFFLQLFVLCYTLGVGSLITIVVLEGFAIRFPNTKFSKYWRKNWIDDDDLENQTK